jgi:hypothetical protein
VKLEQQSHPVLDNCSISTCANFFSLQVSPPADPGNKGSQSASPQAEDTESSDKKDEVKQSSGGGGGGVI